MRTGDDVPRVCPDSPSRADARDERKGLGCLGHRRRGGPVLGIFTDGDLRRLIEKGADLAPRQGGRSECQPGTLERSPSMPISEENKQRPRTLVCGRGAPLSTLNI
jgi:hypothetical protein